MFYCNLVHNNIWPNWEKNADKICIFRTLHDKYLRVVFCELIQDMVHSAALWFIQQSHHLTYPHDEHPTWNLFTLIKNYKTICMQFKVYNFLPILQTNWMKFAIPNQFFWVLSLLFISICWEKTLLFYVIIHLYWVSIYLFHKSGTNIWIHFHQLE